MTAPPQDALEYSRAMQARVQRALVDRGHSACPGNESAHFSFEQQRVFCGCGKSFEMVGAQPVRPAEAEAFSAANGVGIATTDARDPVQAQLAVIDPTMAYTPVDLEMRILDVLARLETGAVFERHAIDDAARKELEWKRAYWVAREASEAGAADRREADAMVKTMELYTAHMEAAWVAKAVKATMHNLRAILSGYQTVNKSVTADMNAGGSVR